jgi:hypothetical protein
LPAHERKFSFVIVANLWQPTPSLEMDPVTCQRCDVATDKPIRLYVGLAQETTSAGPLPLQPLRLTGGFLDICGDCYGEWLAAIKTWYELARKHVEAMNHAAGVQ